MTKKPRMEKEVEIIPTHGSALSAPLAWFLGHRLSIG
jgi:hypothetical protein